MARLSYEDSCRRLQGKYLEVGSVRRSSFRSCDFSGARMDEAILTRGQGAKLNLSDEQRSVIAWASDDGAEPSGG